MIRVLMIAAIPFVAACSRQEADPPASREAASGSQAPAAPSEVPVLEGQWRVAAIDGKPVDSASAMTASFAGGKASISAGCVRRAFAYSQKRNLVSFTASPSGSANCEGRGTSAEQETASVALQQASIVIFSKDGSEASLSGTGGNLTLQRR